MLPQSGGPKPCFPIFSFGQNYYFGQRRPWPIPLPPQICHRTSHVSTTLPNCAPMPCQAGDPTYAFKLHIFPSPLSHRSPKLQKLDFSVGSRAALKSYFCTLSLLLLPARTHASHGLETTELSYRLEARFRDSDANAIQKILFQYYY